MHRVGEGIDYYLVKKKVKRKKCVPYLDKGI